MEIEKLLNYSDDEFISFIAKNDDYITNQKIVDKIFAMNEIVLNKFISSVNNNILTHLIENHSFLNCSEKSLRIIYSRVDTDLKLKIIEKEDALIKILKMPKNSYGRSLFSQADLQVKIEILKKKHIIDQISSELFFELLDSLSELEFDYVTSAIIKTGFISNKENLINYLEGKYALSEKKSDLEKTIIDTFIEKPSLTYYLRKIESFEQLYIFVKFNLFVKITVSNGFVFFQDGSSISFEFLEKLNRKHLKQLCEDLLTSDKTAQKHHVLINAVKLYTLVGYDGAYKVANGKFQNLTPLAIDRSARAYAVNQRENCRARNERKFYSNELKNNIIDAIETNNINYIKEIFLVNEKGITLFNELKAEYEKINNRSDSENFERCIKNYIEQRESVILKENINHFKKEISSKEQLSFSNEKIYKMLFDVETKRFSKNEKANEKLITFLLGDLRNDNDALFRLLINDCAFGLEKSIAIILNKFELVNYIIEERPELSMFRIFDIIDIATRIIYEAKPDEKDIPFSSLINLYNDTTHINNDKEETFAKALNLHKKRKFKTYSSIPIIEGSHDDVTYRVMEFDDPNIIAIGVNNGTCFRVGAFGEEFLEYVMTKPHAVILEIKHANITYTCPIVRNGNGLYANGIDPKFKNELARKKIMHALEQCGKEFIKASYAEEPIEFLAISNLNQIEELANDGYLELDMRNYIQHEDTFHADYQMKKDSKIKADQRRVFVIANNGTVKPKYFLPKSQFFQERIKTLNYDTKSTENAEKIENLINFIKYSSIEFKSIPLEEKEALRRQHKDVSIREFSLVWCNKDWFVARDHEGNLIYERLDFDSRSRTEFATALGIFEQFYKKVK